MVYGRPVALFSQKEYHSVMELRERRGKGRRLGVRKKKGMRQARPICHSALQSQRPEEINILVIANALDRMRGDVRMKVLMSPP